MKKYILIQAILALIISNSYSQSLFFMGDKSYQSTNSFVLKSNAEFDKDDLIVQIAKKGNTGILALTAVSRTGVLIKGKAIVYLEDGNVITCFDRGIYDHVDNKATSVYYLTEQEINQLKKSNINTIRYSLKCGNCSMSSEEGDYSASNKTDPYSSIHQKADVPIMIKELIK